MQIILVDFGYAADGDIKQLTKYRGSETYIAPEINMKFELEFDQQKLINPTGKYLLSYEKSTFRRYKEF